MRDVQAILQSGFVKGQVVDEKGEPIIGASISVKGTTNGVITDMDGNFTLNNISGGVLIISYVGFQTQEVNITGKPLKIVLREDSEMLDEIVVVGYGVQKKATLSGSVTQVKGDEVPSFPGREEVRVIVSPGMVPCSAEATLCVDFPASTSSPFTWVTDPERVAFF